MVPSTILAIAGVFITITFITEPKDPISSELKTERVPPPHPVVHL